MAARGNVLFLFHDSLSITSRIPCAPATNIRCWSCVSAQQKEQRCSGCCAGFAAPRSCYCSCGCYYNNSPPLDTPAARAASLSCGLCCSWWVLFVTFVALFAFCSARNGQCVSFRYTTCLFLLLCGYCPTLFPSRLRSIRGRGPVKKGQDTVYDEALMPSRGTVGLHFYRSAGR